MQEKLILSLTFNPVLVLSDFRTNRLRILLPPSHPGQVLYHESLGNKETSII